MSALGAHVASTLGAFRATTLGARGSGEEPTFLIEYWVSGAYRFNQVTQNWDNFPGATAPTRINNFLWARTSLFDGLNWINPLGGPPGEDVLALSNTDYLITLAITNGARVDTFDINTFQRALDGTLSVPANTNNASFTVLLGSDIYVSFEAVTGTPPRGAIFRRDAPGSWSIVHPTDFVLPNSLMDKRSMTSIGSTAIVDSVATNDAVPQLDDTGYTFGVFDGTEASLETIINNATVGTGDDEIFRWQGDSGIQAAVALQGDVYLIGEELSSPTAGIKGVLKVNPSSVTRVATPQGGDVLGISVSADGRLILSGSFTGFAEHAGPALDRVCYFDPAGGTFEQWAPPLGTLPLGQVSYATEITFTEGLPVSISAPGDVLPQAGVPYQQQLVATNATAWMRGVFSLFGEEPFLYQTGLYTIPNPQATPANAPGKQRVYAAGVGGYDSLEFDVYISSVAPILPVIPDATETVGNLFFYQDTLVAGDGRVNFDIVSEDFPPGTFVTASINFDQFNIFVGNSPVVPAGIYTITVRADNVIGFDEATFQLEYVDP